MVDEQMNGFQKDIEYIYSLYFLFDKKSWSITVLNLRFNVYILKWYYSYHSFIQLQLVIYS